MSLFRRVQRVVDAQRAAIVPPIAHLFDQQLQVTQDPAKFKALLCGRRAGKTGTAIYDFAQGMIDVPGSRNLYIALTMGSAREIFWEPFKRASELHKWGFTFDEAKLIAKHPNGSRLLIRGADDVRELEKLRGVAFHKIRIDECGAHRPSYLKYLVEEVLEATLMDCDGDAWLMGTCTAQAFGYFYDITTGRLPGYSVHRWTAANNPHVDFARFVYDQETGLLKRRGWTVENGIFRREYLAEWVVDSDRKVYRFERLRNVLERLPELQGDDSYRRVLALDFGVGHKTAACVMTHPRRFGRWACAEHTWAKTGLAPSDACDLIAITVAKYAPDVIVGDIGGLGKAFQMEWNKRFPQVAMKAAEKTAKRAAIEFTSDALYTANAGDGRGLFSLECNEGLHREWSSVLWDEQRTDIADGQDDDESHAAMYAYRECLAWLNAHHPEPVPEPVVNTTHEHLVHKPTIPDRYKGIASGWRARR